MPVDRKSKSRRKWSMKYKKSINCRNPKGFSQKQHCIRLNNKNGTFILFNKITSIIINGTPSVFHIYNVYWYKYGRNKTRKNKN